MYKLVICDDEGKTTIVPLIRDEITVGRLEGNTIRLTDRNISRHHARLIRKDDLFIIEDLNSLCGTKINGKPVAKKAQKITPKDQITIGDYSLSIRTDVSAEVPLGKQMDPGDSAGIGKVASRARLVMLTDPSPGLDVELTADLYVLGRSDDANFRINHPSISRAHTRLDHSDGEWTISDLDSINGILINGLKKDDYVLKSGDIVQLGVVQLRYVAPGEPYEFNPSDSVAPVETKRPGSALKAFYIIGAVAIIAAGAIVASVVYKQRSGDSADPDPTVLGEEFQTVTFEELMEQGKDKIQTEEWAEAAHLFALCLQKRSKSQSARDLKELAIRESDAQQAFNKALVALENKSWRRAFELLSSIPRSSHYYDVEQIKNVSDMLCVQLIKRARKAVVKGNLPRAMEILGEIDGLPETPQSCKDKQRLIIEEIEPRLSGGDQSRKSGSSRSRTTDPDRSRRPRKKSSINNPYD